MTIEICNNCKGYGHEQIRVYDGPRDSSWDVIKCSRCKGSGRLTVKTVTTIEPFKYDYDKHRHNL